MEQLREPSKDHQGQVSVIATRQSLTAILDPPRTPKRNLRRSWTHKSNHSTRARPWCAHTSAPPRGSPVWLLALPIYQLDGNKLACANSTEAACQESSPRFHVSQVDCMSPEGRKNRRFRNLLRRFLKFSRETGRKR